MARFSRPPLNVVFAEWPRVSFPEFVIFPETELSAVPENSAVPLFVNPPPNETVLQPEKFASPEFFTSPEKTALETPVKLTAADSETVVVFGSDSLPTEKVPLSKETVELPEKIVSACKEIAPAPVPVTFEENFTEPPETENESENSTSAAKTVVSASAEKIDVAFTEENSNDVAVTDVSAPSVVVPEKVAVVFAEISSFAVEVKSFAKETEPAAAEIVVSAEISTASEKATSPPEETVVSAPSVAFPEKDKFPFFETSSVFVPDVVTVEL